MLLTRDRIQDSSTSYVWSVVFGVFSTMYQTVDLATPNVCIISLMDLFLSFSLMMACFTDSDSDFGLHIKGWPHQFLNTNAQFKMNSRPFICLLSLTLWGNKTPDCETGHLKKVISTSLTWFKCKCSGQELLVFPDYGHSPEAREPEHTLIGDLRWK